MVVGRSITDDFVTFRSEYPQWKACLPRTEEEWTYHQGGPPRDDPLIFLHGTSGTAGSFFYQTQELAAKGYRVLSVQYPGYSTPEEWCKGFDVFLDVIKVTSAHIFGAGLGGFLAQCFAARHTRRVRSLLLCNSFSTTGPFAEQAGSFASVVHYTPTPILRKIMHDSFPQTGPMEMCVKQATDWIAAQLNDVCGDDLAGRLSLNGTASTCGVVPMEHRLVTLLESNGETMVPDMLRRELRNRYSGARLSQLKATGDFPYVSHPDELTVFIEVHMRGVGVYVGRHLEQQEQATERGQAKLQGDDHDGDEGAKPRPVRRPWQNPFLDDPFFS